jgi:hypothetical protein
MTGEDNQSYGLSDDCVIGSVGRGEGYRESLGSGTGDSSGSRGVGEDAGDQGGGVELRSGKCSSVSDGGWRGPRNHGGCFIDG